MKNLESWENDVTKETVVQEINISAIHLGSTTPSTDNPGNFDSLSPKTNYNDFVTIWNAKQITIPTNTDFTYNYKVDWTNDGISDQMNISGDASHNL